MTDSAAIAEPATARCFHCGQAVPPGTDLFVPWDDAPRPMCCAGCAAVAQAIIDGGLSEYYRHRSALAPTGRELVPEFLRQTAVYDHPTVQQSFVRDVGAHVREAALILEGITCAACVWLNERHIARQPGVLHVQINYATHRAQVRWDERQTHLSEILQAISRIGYLAHPYDPGRNQQILETERKRQLRRLGLAGVMAAQVMTLSEALYLGDGPVTENEFRPFFNWVSLLLTSPVLVYSAQPFFRGAWNDLRHGRAGMDVPVTLGIVTAFLASLWATLTGEGVTYYDSVTMFVFFLLGGRYLELMARKRATEASENLVHALPAMATRVGTNKAHATNGEGMEDVPATAAVGASGAHGATQHLPPLPHIVGGGEGGGEGANTNNAHDIHEIVPVAELSSGDVVLVRPGENIPADGTVLEGRSSVDESLLTGESLPLPKTVDAAVIGGSINIESPLIVRVDKVGPDTVLSSILRLLDRAQTEKPRLAQLADRLAGWFVAAVLVLAAATALYWWQHDITQWLPATIAVLVVTCPCALSLATPAALTAATGSLTRLGLLATRGHALETLARATHFVFDKTGTLTLGRPRLLATHTFASLPAAECLQCAAALEQHSEHPIAQALLAATGVTSAARDIVNTPGAGIHGTINGEVFYLGTPQFIDEQTGKAPAPAILDDLRRDGATVVLLATRTQLCATFALADALRPGAEALIRGLKQQGKQVMLLTGDHEQAAQRVARALGIDAVGFDLKPADKLARVKALQHQGAVVAMIGDGINDAPVLAGAQVSIAMGRAAHIAAASADMVLLSQHLPHLLDGIHTAQRTLRIIRQNLAWALAYNLLAVPAAALGYVAPWLAALGMSLSSLFVVANALRIARQQNQPRPS